MVSNWRKTHHSRPKIDHARLCQRCKKLPIYVCKYIHTCIDLLIHTGLSFPLTVNFSCTLSFGATFSSPCRRSSSFMYV